MWDLFLGYKIPSPQRLAPFSFLGMRCLGEIFISFKSIVSVVWQTDRHKCLFRISSFLPGPIRIPLPSVLALLVPKTVKPSGLIFVIPGLPFCPSLDQVLSSSQLHLSTNLSQCPKHKAHAAEGFCLTILHASGSPLCRLTQVEEVVDGTSEALYDPGSP